MSEINELTQFFPNPSVKSVNPLYSIQLQGLFNRCGLKSKPLTFNDRDCIIETDWNQTVLAFNPLL